MLLQLPNPGSCVGRYGERGITWKPELCHCDGYCWAGMDVNCCEDLQSICPRPDEEALEGYRNFVKMWLVFALYFISNKIVRIPRQYLIFGVTSE